MFRYFVALIDRTSEIYNFEKKLLGRMENWGGELEKDENDF